MGVSVGVEVSVGMTGVGDDESMIVEKAVGTEVGVGAAGRVKVAVGTGVELGAEVGTVVGVNVESVLTANTLDCFSSLLSVR